MTKKITVSPEDQALFQHEMRQVTPLKTKKTKIALERHPRPYTRPSQLAPEPDWVMEDLSDYYAHPVEAESILAYHQPSTGKQQINALRTGKLCFEAKLDLHGLKPDEAKIRLSQFIARQIQNHHRWVLIVHGKGGRFGEAPVLKNLVNHWLCQLSTVLAFHSAQPKHGGAGAVYVLLKKRFT